MFRGGQYMLASHLNEIERTLLQLSKIPSNAGHSLHKGTPRESFIHQYLKNHLSELAGFGTGEVIDYKSAAGERRNQIDLIIYKKNYPKLDFGGGINGFLAESVISTIEVKSVLTELELRNSFNSIRNVKKLKQRPLNGIYTGYRPPGILSFVVAYDGPATMETVYGWIDKYNTDMNMQYPLMPINGQERQHISSPVAEAIIILGKGVILFDNSPFSVMIKDEHRRILPNGKWSVINSKDNNLLLLFLFLTLAIEGSFISFMDIGPYLLNATFSKESKFSFRE